MKTSLTGKLIVVLLCLALLPLALISFIAAVDLDKVFKTFSLNSETIQQSTYQESKRIVEKLTQDDVKEIARHVVREMDLYLGAHSMLKLAALQTNPEFRRIALQPVGQVGDTSVYEIPSGISRFNLNPALVNTGPATWGDAYPEYTRLVNEHLVNNGKEIGGFYTWQEPNGKVRKKYMYLVPVTAKTADGVQLGLMASTFIDENSGALSAINDKTQKILAKTQSDTAMILSSLYVRNFIILGILVIVVILVTLLFIQQTVKPIRQLINEMNSFALGNKQVVVNVSAHDEIGQLAKSFDSMIKMILKEENKTKEIYIGIIATLAKALEAKDAYTLGHTERVTDYAVKIAQYMGLSEEETETINKAALLHDIGKIGIKPEILDKKESLTPEERTIIKTHPVLGINILSPIKILGDILPIIRYHHERFDGTGYPEGLSTDEIPLGARILAVADSFDAMTSDRPYHLRLSLDDAIMELENNSGTQFDPDVVKALLVILKKEYQYQNPKRKEG